MTEEAPGQGTVMAAALRLLGVRARSRAELADRLTRRGFDRSLVDSILDRLKEMGYLDDDAFAGAYVSQCLASRPQGRRRLMAGLLRRGLGRETASRAVERGLREWFDERYPGSGAEHPGRIESALAVEALHRRLRGRGADPAGPEAQYRRHAQFLQRRGFDRDTVSRVLRQELGEAPGSTTA